jgi:hypothetical protein
MVERIAPDPDSQVPAHLYKYRSLRGEAKKFARDLIVNQRLYFAKPVDLNDPFEFRPALDTSVTPEQKRAYIKRLVQKIYSKNSRPERRRIEKRLDTPSYKEAVANSYRMTMDKIGVFSMSAQHLHLLMWPHYADNHAGICVRFNTLALIQAGLVPMSVTYSQARPITYPMLDEPQVMLDNAARTKGLPWAYEEEWRLIVNRGGGQIIPVASPIVSGVILGARISEEDRIEVMRWVAECKHPVEVLQASIHERDYALETHSIDLGR